MAPAALPPPGSTVPEKVDLKKELKAFYTSPTQPTLVDVPAGWFLTYEGEGAPGDEGYTGSLGALYAVAYTLKFASKGRGKDFVVMPLETLWWAEEGKPFREDAPPETWGWKSLLRVPDFVTSEHLEEAREEAVAKRGLQEAHAVRLERLEEGPSAQVLHVGSYAEERPTIDRLHAFIRDEGLRPRGVHHEIYLSDPNRTAPENLKTLIRQPVETP